MEKHENEVQIEHSRHKVIDGIRGGEHAAHDERDEPEASTSHIIFLFSICNAWIPHLSLGLVLILNGQYACLFIL